MGMPRLHDAVLCQQRPLRLGLFGHGPLKLGVGNGPLLWCCRPPSLSDLGAVAFSLRCTWPCDTNNASCAGRCLDPGTGSLWRRLRSGCLSEQFEDDGQCRRQWVGAEVKQSVTARFADRTERRAQHAHTPPEAAPYGVCLASTPPLRRPL